MSPDQGCLTFAHRWEERSEARSIGIQSVPGSHEVIREPPQSVGTTVAGKTSEVVEIIVEQSQIDHSSAWKMFVDGTRISLGVRSGVVLKSPKGAILNTTSS